MENKKYNIFCQFIYLASFLLPNIAFLIIPSSYAFDNNLSFIDKVIIFNIYMIPTILFFLCLREIKKINVDKEKRKINICILKESWFEIILFIFSGIIGIYLLEGQFFYISIPIILIAIELCFIRILDFSYFYENLCYLWKNKKCRIVSKDELKRYNKWTGFPYSVIVTIIYFTFILVLLSLPALYFNILNFNIITIILFLGACSIFFIWQTPFQQILDCKFNSFVKCQGICISYEQSGKGTGGYHTIKVLEISNQEITFNAKKPVFRNGEKVILIIGVHSNQVIGFRKFMG